MNLTYADVAAAYEPDVWPDNWQVTSLFVDLLTQWRTGFSGTIGLDYTAIPVVMDLRGIPPEDRSDLFDDLRVMECGALAQMRSKQ